MGSIRRHEAADGTITYRVRRRVVDPETGKNRHLQRTFSSKRAAERGDVAWAAEIAAGRAVVPSRVTVASLLDDWLSAEAAHLASTSQHAYEQSMRLHLVPDLGHYPVQKLTVAHVETFYERLAAEGYARNSLQMYAKPLVQALDRAERRGLVPSNVARRARMPLPVRRDSDDDGDATRAWTREQVAAFLQAAQGTRHELVWRVLLGTGLRRGEVVGLRWSDLDATPTPEAPHGRLQVLQIVRHLPRRTELSRRGKSTAGERTLYLTASVAQALRLQQHRVAALRTCAGDAWVDHDLIFPRADGRQTTPNSLRHHFCRAIARAGVPPLTLHGTRHTYATLALQARVPVHVLSKVLGHANVVVTLQVYAHVLRQQETEVVSVMDSVIFGDAAGDTDAPGERCVSGALGTDCAPLCAPQP